MWLYTSSSSHGQRHCGTFFLLLFSVSISSLVSFRQKRLLNYSLKFGLLFAITQQSQQITENFSRTKRDILIFDNQESSWLWLLKVVRELFGLLLISTTEVRSQWEVWKKTGHFLILLISQTARKQHHHKFVIWLNFLETIPLNPQFTTSSCLAD